MDTKLKIQNYYQALKKKKKKYLVINLSKHIQGLYAESYKMLMKEIKPGIDKWRDMWFSGVRKLIMVKMSILPLINENLDLHKTPYMNAHSNFIHNS